jgi:hypothetical protein
LSLLSLTIQSQTNLLLGGSNAKRVRKQNFSITNGGLVLGSPSPLQLLEGVGEGIIRWALEMSLPIVKMVTGLVIFMAMKQF